MVGFKFLKRGRLNGRKLLTTLSDHLLCRWHININVVVKTKKHFKTETYNAFYTAWTAVIDSVSEEEYIEKLAELQTQGRYPAIAVKYVVKTWLVWKEKIVRTLLLPFFFTL